MAAAAAAAVAAAAAALRGVGEMKKQKRGYFKNCYSEHFFCEAAPSTSGWKYHFLFIYLFCFVSTGSISVVSFQASRRALTHDPSLWCQRNEEKGFILVLLRPSLLRRRRKRKARFFLWGGGESRPEIKFHWCVQCYFIFISVSWTFRCLLACCKAICCTSRTKYLTFMKINFFLLFVLKGSMP